MLGHMYAQNLYKKTGSLFYAFGALSLAVYLLAFINFSTFVGIVLLVIQILIIVNAKKASKAYNQPPLNIFGSLMIASIILAFIEVGVAVAEIFQVAIASVRSGTGFINLTPIVVTAVAIGICSSFFELLAWIAMISFFKRVETSSNQKKGTGASFLVLIATIIAVTVALAIGIPFALMEFSMYASTGMILTTGPIVFYNMMNEIFSFVGTILAVISYFMLGAAFNSLGQVNAISSGPSPTYAPAMHGPTITPVMREPVITPSMSEPRVARQFLNNCPYCGVSLMADKDLQFCPSCGARLPVSN